MSEPSDNELCERIDALGDTVLRLIDHLQEQRNEYAEILHDILMVEAELEHAPADWIARVKERKAKAWARAWEKFEP